MATSLMPFQRCHIGIESTKGTLVAATRALVGEHMMTEEMDFYRSPYPAGHRANPGGTGSVLRRGTTVEINTDLTAEEILWFLETGVLGGVSPSTVDTNGKQWDYAPELTTGVPTIKTATLEMVRGDGVTNHYYREAGYGMTESFRMEWNFNQIATLSARMFARAGQTGTPTASLVPYPTREPLASNLLSVYYDTTAYADIGDTALTGLVRSATFEYNTGYAADYVLDGRADADFGLHKVGLARATLGLVMEFDATAAAKFANFRSNVAAYIRLKSTGSLVGAVSAVKTVQIDGAYRFTTQPSFSNDGEQVIATFSLESFYDTTAAKTIEFSVINALAAIT